MLSRIEKILRSKILGISYDEQPQSRIEDLLIESNKIDTEANQKILNDLNSIKKQVDDIITNFEKNPPIIITKDSDGGEGA